MKHNLSGPLVMLNVPDVAAAMAWYQNLGFTIERTNRKWEPTSEVNWAFMSYDKVQMMLNARMADEGAHSIVTLYFNVADCDAFYAEIRDKVAVRYEPSDQFYGMRDFEVLDLNGNSLIFGHRIEEQTEL